jgi:hypothetical protein
VRSWTTWSEQAKLTASDAAAGDYFGSSVSINGNTAIIGAYGDDDAGSASGSAYVFVRSGTTWSEQVKLTASDAAAGDQFGSTVSISWNTAIVGAGLDDDAGSASGSAYVFVRSGATWSEHAKLTTSDAAAGDFFGSSVSVSGDTAIAGARWDDDAGSASGSAYIYEDIAPTITEIKIMASDAATLDHFGGSVSISGDTAIVGVNLDDDAGGASGSAYVFVRSGTTWSEQAKLTASDAAAGDQFGWSVSISGDTAIVGANFDDDAGSDSGSAYIYEDIVPTITDIKLTASDAAAGDFFGFSVSISGDTAIVGAYGDDDAGAFSGSAYVFVWSDTTWIQQAKLIASDAAAGDQFGSSVSISGDTAIVGAPLHNDAGSDSGSAYVFVRSGTTWSEQAKLTASDAAAGDQFGFSVSISGNTAIIGANLDDDAGSDSGSAYVFVRSWTTWIQHAKLTASDAASGDHFGSSVSISGETAIVGARWDDDAGSYSGSAYVFVRSWTIWIQQAKLTASDAAARDVFGFSVSISGDTAIVGAFGNNDAGSSSGSAYVFVRSGTTWSEQAKLIASDAAAGDQFGFSVAISRNTAIVGARLDDDAGSKSGSAYVFVRSGTTWIQHIKLTASDAAADDFFGFSVSISGDTAIIGAYGDDDAGSASGSAYIYEDIAPTRTEIKLTASDAVADDRFGSSVAISGDTAIVGAYWDDDAGSKSGSAYVFVRSGTTWYEQAKLTASDAAAGDHFGFSVAISRDTAIIGAYWNDDAGYFSGSAYVFVRSGTTWSEQAKLTASDAAARDFFGFSVAICGDTAIVGAPGDADAGDGSGSAYEFVRSGTTWIQKAKLTALDAAAGDSFGWSVSISGDTAIIGSYWDDDAGSASGSAYVFVWGGTAWFQQAKLTASDAATLDHFGFSVSISGDTAIVGAPWDDNAGSASGSAYEFVRSGTTWSEHAKLTASDAAAGDSFGWSVSISGDIAIVGADWDDDAGSASGSAYVYDYIVFPNTPAGTSVDVSDTDVGVTITFSEVTNSGSTIFTVNDEGPLPPIEFQLYSGLYYEITTSAAYTGPITICINYDDGLTPE